MPQEYEKTIWIDHVIDPQNGEIIQQGTRFTAQRMNKIEQGIFDSQLQLTQLREFLNYMPINGGSFDGNDPTGPVIDGGIY